MPMEMQAIAVASERLTQSIQAVVSNLSDGRPRPTELSRTLGLGKDFTSRLLTAVTKPDALAAAYAMPGPAPIRTLLRAARRRGVPHQLLSEAEDAITAFETMMTEHVGDKTGLNALISTWLPEVREEIDTTARQLAFRGVSLVKGLCADVSVASFILHPSASNQDRCDSAMVGGWIGLRRLKPRVPMRFIAYMLSHAITQPAASGAVDADFYETFMTRHSDQPLPVAKRHTADRTEYWLDDRGVGPNSSVNVFLTEFYRGTQPFKRQLGKPDSYPFFFSGIDVPIKTLIFDMLVSTQLWPGCDPELRVYDTAASGPANPNDPTRDVDIMAPSATLTPLGVGLEMFRSGLIPNYTEMLLDVVRAHGWSGSKFRGYRCHIAYPLYGSQPTIVFRPPG